MLVNDFSDLLPGRTPPQLAIEPRQTQKPVAILTPAMMNDVSPQTKPERAARGQVRSEVVVVVKGTSSEVSRPGVGEGKSAAL